MIRPILRLSLIAATVAATPAFAVDTVTLKLTAPVQTIAATGGVVSFFVTLSAPATNNAAVYLNGDTINLYGAISLRDDELFSLFPESLAPGQAASGLLFTVLVPASAGKVSYSGVYDLLGGATDTSMATLAEARFEIDVAAAAAVPEAASWATMILGMGAVGYALRRRRATVALAA